jgi:hypothetical protein
MNCLERGNSLELFKFFAAKVYGKATASWLFNNWKYVEPWHFKLIEHLKKSFLIDKSKVLQLSLCVMTSDVSLFAEYANSFGKTPCSSLIFEYL